MGREPNMRLGLHVEQRGGLKKHVRALKQRLDRASADLQVGQVVTTHMSCMRLLILPLALAILIMLAGACLVIPRRSGGYLEDAAGALFCSQGLLVRERSTQASSLRHSHHGEQLCWSTFMSALLWHPCTHAPVPAVPSRLVVSM